MSASVEVIVLWFAVAAYAVSTVGFTWGAFSRRSRYPLAFAAAWAGALAHAAGIAVRWLRTGHGPYLGFFEVAALLALMAVVGFLALAVRRDDLGPAGVAMMPVALLVLGGSLLADTAPQPTNANLASAWLVVHVIFANLAFGLYAAACAVGAGYLVRRSKRAVGPGESHTVSPTGDLLYRLVGAGFVFQTVMIVSGSIWANEAWGRYWGWDPVETWSLIAWAVYALYLHLTLMLGWRGRRAAWLAVIALPVILFSLLGVPIVYQSIHGAYLAL